MSSGEEGKKRVLIADDEAWYLEALRDALEYEGYLVEQARSASETLAKVSSSTQRPHLLVLDVMMNPGDLEGDHQNGTRTGVLVLQKVRQELGLDADLLPVICLTVLENVDLRNIMTNLGARFVCKREAKISEIILLIASLLQADPRQSPP